MDEIQVIKDAIEKHNIQLKITPENLEEIAKLVRYALHVGFNNGYQEGMKETEIHIENLKRWTK
ncbi:MAG: hypothetical protein RLY43_2159 [Bacteroidota bacterium]|jgi:flagellar biosynthesis/type III secretory pathway protein FliH